MKQHLAREWTLMAYPIVRDGVQAAPASRDFLFWTPPPASEQDCDRSSKF
jgi:hypothetical protein